MSIEDRSITRDNKKFRLSIIAELGTGSKRYDLGKLSFYEKEKYSAFTSLVEEGVISFTGERTFPGGGVLETYSLTDKGREVYSRLIMFV